MIAAIALLPVAAVLAQAPDVRVRASAGIYTVEGRFQVGVSSALAWEVLTDYDRIGEFVSGMRRSAVKERSPGRVLVEQEAVGRAFFVSRQARVLLEVREEPLKSLRFEDVSLRDFELYRGAWELSPSGEGLVVAYKLEAKPMVRAPWFLGRRAFRTGAAELLDQVRAEMARRAR